MLARISALVVWAFVAATVVFWGLRLLVRSPAAPASAVAVGESSAVRGDLVRLFGAAPTQVAAAAAPVPEAASRFRLLGVMAPRRSSGAGGGVALIAVDGKPARAYAVGTALDDSLVLKSVSLRSASIGPADGAPAVTLEMPQLPSAATGVLPPMGGAPVPSSRPVPSYPPVPAPVPGGPQAPFGGPQPGMNGVPNVPAQ